MDGRRRGIEVCARGNPGLDSGSSEGGSDGRKKKVLNLAFNEYYSERRRRHTDAGLYCWGLPPGHDASVARNREAICSLSS